MILLPAIDLKDGACVRLRRGEFHTAQRVAEDALDTAQGFYAAGARWLHMVDLDGAREGRRKNFAIVERVIRQSGLQVELGGGIRTEADLLAAMEAGAARVVIGSAAVTDPELVRSALRRWPERVAVGIDCLEGRVRTAGWERDSGVSYLEFARKMENLGVKYIIFTDIATDGMLSGPSFDRIEALLRAVPACRVIASGGVSSLEDVRRLRETGVYGAIVGKACYTGALDFAQAIRAAE